MSLEKIIKEDKIEIVDQGDYKVVQVRTATIIMDSGSEISRSFSRHVVVPTSDVSGESQEVQKLAEIYFTDESKEKFKQANDADSIL